MDETIAGSEAFGMADGQDSLGRRGRGVVIGAAVLTAVLLIGGVAILGGPDDPAPAVPAAVAGATTSPNTTAAPRDTTAVPTSASPVRALWPTVQPYLQALADLDGFVDSTVHRNPHGLTVLWHEQVPGAATDVAATAEANGISVELVAVPYTAWEMLEAATAVTEELGPGGGLAEIAADFRSVTVPAPKSTVDQEALRTRLAPILGAVPLTYREPDSIRGPFIDGAETIDREADRGREVFVPFLDGPGYIAGRLDIASRVVMLRWSAEAGSVPVSDLESAEREGYVVRIETVDGPRTFAERALAGWCAEPLTVGGFAYLGSEPPEVYSCEPNADLTGVVVIGPELENPSDVGALEDLLAAYGAPEVPITVVPFDPEDPPVKSEARILQEEQQKMMTEVVEPADPYWGRIGSMDGFVDGGYGVKDQPGVPGLFIYWDGPRTPELEAAIAEAAADGVIIVINDMEFTEDEIFAVGGRVMHALEADGIGVTSFGPTISFTGLSITGPKVSTDSGVRTRARELAAPLLGGMPLEFGEYFGEYMTLEQYLEPARDGNGPR